MFCSKCFRPAGEAKDAGEWMEPVKSTGERRPSAGRAPRASVKWETLRNYVLEENKQPSVRWADVVDRAVEDAPDGPDGVATSVEDASSRSSVGSDGDGNVVEDHGFENIPLGADHEGEKGESANDGKARKTMFSLPAASATKKKKKKTVFWRGDSDASDSDAGDAPTTKKKKKRGKTMLWRHSDSDASAASTASAPSRMTLNNARLTMFNKSGGNPLRHSDSTDKSTFLQKRMTLKKMQEPNSFDISAMKNWFTSSDPKADPKPESPKRPAVTSIAVLSDAYFLTASRSENVIKMHKAAGRGGVELCREFKGHRSGVTDLVRLCCKGRFLSAGMDKTLRLWDSRFDLEDEHEDEGGIPEQPMILLATFDSINRMIYSIGVLKEGSYVRPTDDIDAAMVAAMAKKAAFEGTAAVQIAAARREIIECSGSFVTLSRNDKKIKMWEMTVADNTGGSSNENVAKIDLAEELEHDASIAAMAVGSNLIIGGDIMGDVIMWERNRRGSMWGIGSKKIWTKLHKFTPRKPGVLHTPDQVSKQSIAKLCLLDKGTFVAATKSGTIRVWDNFKGEAKTYEVYKKHHSQSMKITSEMVSGIQKLPPLEDPNTGEACLGFSVSSTDGHVVSMALYPRDMQKKSELVMFHVYANGEGEDAESITAVDSIAVLQAFSSTNGESFDSVVVAGDSSGTIKTMKPEWKSVAIA